MEVSRSGALRLAGQPQTRLALPFLPVLILVFFSFFLARVSWKFWVFFLGVFFVVGIWFSDEEEMVGGGNCATALVV